MMKGRGEVHKKRAGTVIFLKSTHSLTHSLTLHGLFFLFLEALLTFLRVVLCTQENKRGALT